MSQNQPSGGRRNDALFSLPTGEDLATFDSYLEAQQLVNTLVTGGVPARSLAIVGSNVSVVERVTGRVGYGRAALSSAVSGSWLGALAGLAFIVINPSDFITPLLGGILIGAGLGMVVGMATFSFSRGPKRLFRSMQQVIAQSYRVVVDSASHGMAQSVMAKDSTSEES